MSQTTNISNLVINKLTKQQYDALDPPNPNELYFVVDDLGVEAGSGLAFSNNTLNHSNSVTAGTAGTSSATSGATLAVPYVTYDAHGHITTSGTHTHTIGSLATSAITSGTFADERIASASTWNAKQDALTFDGTYNASTNKAATVSTVTNAINALDGGTIGTPGTGKTITALSETNGQISATFGNISITKSQVSDFPTIPTATSDLTNDSGFITSSDIPVTSVNTKTGAVTLSSSDVGAIADPTTKSSGQFLKYNGTSWIADTPPSAPVTSVNSKTGAVVLTASDVGALPDSTTIPGGSSTSPKMDGTATVGTETAWAHGDHVHPTDTSRQAKITASGILKGDGSGGVTAAVSGTDYQSPITFDGTYNASTNKAATVSTVTNAINALDGGTIGTPGSGKTITALSQTNGNISATFGNISITKSQVSDFPTIPTATSDLTNDSGFITSSDIPVTSVNTKTGAVSLSASDVGALSDSTTYVSSVNGNSGAVTVTDEKVKQTELTSTGTTKSLLLAYNNNSSETTDGIYKSTQLTYKLNSSDPELKISRANGQRYAVLSPVGLNITSVNTGNLGILQPGNLSESRVYTFPNATGTVALTSDIPDSTSDLTNDSGFITSSDIPVTSVNTKTGAVSLTASDVGALPDSTSIPAATTTSPKMDGTAAVGSETTWAKGDHVHPTDTSRAPLASPALTGTPTAPTASTSTDNTQIATTAFVHDVVDALGSVLNYKGTKATASQLPTTGNTTGDVWIVTEDNSEYVWNGTAWEKLGPTIDLSGYVPTTRTVNSKALSSDITLSASDVGALPDSTDVTKWNGVTLNTNGAAANNNTYYVPAITSGSYSGTTARYVEATTSPGSNKIPKYDVSSYLISTTPSANDNSSKVATTAYVDSAISGAGSAPKAVTNSALTASSGVFTWSISASDAFSSANILITVYEVSTGAVVYPNIVVNQSTGAVTITIQDTASAGTLAAGTYKAVMIG